MTPTPSADDMGAIAVLKEKGWSRVGLAREVWRLRTQLASRAPSPSADAAGACWHIGTSNLCGEHGGGVFSRCSVRVSAPSTPADAEMGGVDLDAIRQVRWTLNAFPYVYVDARDSKVIVRAIELLDGILSRHRAAAGQSPPPAAVRGLVEALREALDVLYPVVIAKHGASSAGRLTIEECDRELCEKYKRWRSALAALEGGK